MDADKRFVPNDPRVVPRRNRPHIAWTKLCFGTVVHSDHYPPRDNVDDVTNLATVGAEEHLSMDDALPFGPFGDVEITNRMHVMALYRCVPR